MDIKRDYYLDKLIARKNDGLNVQRGRTHRIPHHAIANRRRESRLREGNSKHQIN